VALCGACTVHIDGEATRACITAVDDIAGRSVVTIEGLDPNGNHPVQKAWRALNVPQCGYCQTGQIMQAAALLATNKNPSEDEYQQRYERQHLPLRLAISASHRRPSRRPPQERDT